MNFLPLLQLQSEDEAKEAKRQWIQTLKVGDSVIDCRHQPATIKRLRPLWGPPRKLEIMAAILFWVLPQSWYRKLGYFVIHGLRIRTLHDYAVMTDQNHICSAMDCLVSVEEWEMVKGLVEQDPWLW